jgi:MoaA/NifB/PqqE/SkfB family radical SAM enzyme
MNPVIEKLPILILNPHSRCNCRCVMCDIWKGTDSRELTAEELGGHLESIRRLGVERVVFSGGEPLMHSDLFRLCAMLREHGIRLTLLSTGLLLERNARAIVDSLDEVILSLDGPRATHTQVRRIPGAFDMLTSGARALKTMRPDFPIHARCTVQRLNCTQLRATAHAARKLGLDGISFLAADVNSTAFNRPEGWPQWRTDLVALTSEDLERLEEEIELLIEDQSLTGFVAESPAKLRRISAHFRSLLELTAPIAPACNAPWVSAVLEADGTVRPCFFHPPLGRVNASQTLIDIVNSPLAIDFRANLNVATNVICRRCVCSLNYVSTESVTVR